MENSYRINKKSDMQREKTCGKSFQIHNVRKLNDYN